ncbi:MAG: hypothetical protein ACTHMQ_13105 [Protaetiibacter sp.]
MAATTALLATPLVLSGCTASPVADFRSEVPPAVLAADSNIHDTHLSFSTGPAGVGFWLRIYVDDASDAAVARSLVAALDAAYAASPSAPTSIQIDVARAPKPEDVELALGAIPISGAADAAGLDPYRLNNSIELSSSDLEERYGPWGVEG